MTDMQFCLPESYSIPVPMPGGTDQPYWDGAANHELRIQKCSGCGTYQFPPDEICATCQRFDPEWVAVKPTGRIFGWTRVWHAVGGLKEAVPYLVVLVELDEAPGIRMLGNVVGDGMQELRVDQPVEAVFEDHEREGIAYTLVQWKAL